MISEQLWPRKTSKNYPKLLCHEKTGTVYLVNMITGSDFGCVCIHSPHDPTELGKFYKSIDVTQYVVYNGTITLRNE